MDRDLSPETHAELDARIARVSQLDIVVFADLILSDVITDSECVNKYADVWPIHQITSGSFTQLLAARPDIEELLRIAHATGSYAPIRRLRE